MREISTYIFKLSVLFYTVLFVFLSVCRAEDRTFQEVGKFNIDEARQGIAVDQNYIYVIDTRRIGKYKKDTGEQVAKWGGKNSPIIHLDSGVIYQGKLYCAHSNYPAVPMTSSVEIWDAETLEHIDSHSFGIRWGSCTWVDRHDGFWWATFAQYDKWKNLTGKGTEWTTVVKLNDRWQALQAWIFPEELLQRLKPMSNSGGSWGPDGLLYCTGHDRSEIYALRTPEFGSVLELVETIPLNILGQGIAWDRSHSGFLYGIRKNERQVTIFEFISQ